MGRGGHPADACMGTLPHPAEASGEIGREASNAAPAFFAGIDLRRATSFTDSQQFKTRHNQLPGRRSSITAAPPDVWNWLRPSACNQALFFPGYA